MQHAGTSEFDDLIRDGTQDAVQTMPIRLDILASFTATTCISCRNKQRSIENSLNIQWIFFQSLSMSSRTGMTSWTQRWEKARRQRILCGWPIKEEIRDERVPRNRMIDSYKIKNAVFEWLKIIGIEEVCRRCGHALADEDHTHHLTVQSNNSTMRIYDGLHSNKQGSNTMPLRYRSDFKQGIVHLVTMDNRKEARRQNQIFLRLTQSNKPKQWEAQSSSSTWWNWQGSWWSSYNSESQEGGEPSLEWTERPVSCSIWQDSSKLTFTNSL